MITEELAEPGTLEGVGPNQPETYRWVVCLLLFLIATFIYVARQVLGLLKPTLQVDLGWNEIGYNNIFLPLLIALAIAFLFFGKLPDARVAATGWPLFVAYGRRV